MLSFKCKETTRCDPPHLMRTDFENSKHLFDIYVSNFLKQKPYEYLFFFEMQIDI